MIELSATEEHRGHRGQASPEEVLFLRVVRVLRGGESASVSSERTLCPHY
jgi:hypothetical protein